MLLLFCFVSCTGLHEARETIAEADSLRTTGVQYDDSLRLDSAYQTLGSWWNRNIHPDDYAGACYYYGRLHRNRGNQVEAMRCFINGTHAQYLYKPIVNPLFSNHSILGRTYSNMGTMCHTIEEYQLSYDMYEKSSEQFLIANDTITYYYALYDMSFELSEMCMYDETMALLNKIENECEDDNVLSYTWITRLNLYDKIEKYDSVIYASDKLQELGNHAAIGYVTKAQAYCHLEQYDSAVFYAKRVMKHPYASPQDKCNMLYILTYNDTAVNEEEIKRRSEERGDIDRYIIDPLEQQVSQAVQILRQDIDRPPKIIHLILFLISVCFLIAVSWFAKIRIRKQHTRAIDDIASKRQQLVSQTIHEHQKQELLLKDQKEIKEHNTNLLRHNEQLQQQTEAHRQYIINEIENNCKRLQSMVDWRNEICWKDFEALCDYMNKTFFNIIHKLAKSYNLNEKEIRLCILVFLGFLSDKQMAGFLFYSDKTIRGAKMRVANKIGTNSAKFRAFLINCVIE